MASANSGFRSSCFPLQQAFAVAAMLIPCQGTGTGPFRKLPQWLYNQAIRALFVCIASIVLRMQHSMSAWSNDLQIFKDVVRWIVINVVYKFPTSQRTSKGFGHNVPVLKDCHTVNRQHDVSGWKYTAFPLWPFRLVCTPMSTQAEIVTIAHTCRVYCVRTIRNATAHNPSTITQFGV